MAGTPRTPNQLYTEILANVADNTSNLITPAMMRTVLNDGVASSVTSIVANVVADGVSDDSGAINAAIAALPLWGGNVLIIPPATGTNTLAIANTILIGNGSGAVPSSVKGIRLIFQGFGANASEVFGFGSGERPGLTLKWTGAAATPMVQVRGPVVGWGIENVTFNGQNVCNYGLEIISGKDGICRSLNFVNCPTSIYSHVNGSFGTADANSMHNMFFDVTMQVPTGGFGIFLSGISGSNSCYNQFFNISASPSSGACTAIKLGACDSNTFWSIHSNCTTGVTLDYTDGLGSWPASNGFYAVDTASGTWGNVGVIAATATANWIDGFAETNGAIFPALTNLVIYDLPDSLPRVNLTAQTGAISTQNVVIQLGVVSAPKMIRCSYYLVMTQAGTGGTFKIRFFWNDPSQPLGGPTQELDSAAVTTTTIGNYTSGSIITYPGASPLTWDVVAAGVTGSPKYTVVIVFERLT